ncbi:antirestriction protein ArdA [Tateyamaria sp.]|uniref:antirestriction protein ArdA n=1 Tax=Tateyamaria sp. TaxID=1929288 RepID=UPI00329B5345
MTISLFAQPYDITATGFYFETAEDYAQKANALRNAHGDPVEEFEIQFIDGEAIDAALARSIDLDQCNFADFLERVARWDEFEKTQMIIALGECGYDFDPTAAPSEYDIDIYQTETMRELAEQFVDEGCFGEMPEHLQSCIDFDAIARDLAVDYAEITIAGERYIYACR